MPREFILEKRERASDGCPAREEAVIIAFQEPPSRSGIKSNNSRASATLPQAARDSMARLKRKVGTDEREVEDAEEEAARWVAMRRAAEREPCEVARRRREA